uniref:DZF domain-containing protein n=1 Tax=Pavo cristatus TaxID=9049 RepID=A0A8C9EVG1_PAVCR
MVKHSTIYPSPEELEAVQNMVSTVECALKHVSDWMDEMNKSVKCESDVEAKEEAGSKWSDLVWCYENWLGCKGSADKR